MQFHYIREIIVFTNQNTEVSPLQANDHYQTSSAMKGEKEDTELSYTTGGNVSWCRRLRKAVLKFP